MSCLVKSSNVAMNSIHALAEKINKRNIDTLEKDALVKNSIPCTCTSIPHHWDNDRLSMQEF